MDTLLGVVQKEHELICKSCGCVLGEVPIQEEASEKSFTLPSVNVVLLGSALEKNVKYRQARTREQFHEERVLQNLINVTKQYSLPEIFAYETFNKLKKNKRGFRSKTEPLNQLLKILSIDDNYIYIHKMRAIKARKDEISSTF